MQLLGPYISGLQAAHYLELLNLYKAQISKGGFAGNATFDTAVISNLITQSQDFATLPLPSEGQVATDDSLNYPLDLLRARFNALATEAASFNTQIASLVATLGKDTALLDQLISAANLQVWIAQQPVLEPAIKFSWDYGMGNGPASAGITKVDPLNGVLYPTNCPTNTYLDVLDGTKFTGLVAPDSSVLTPVKDLIWNWTPMTPGEQAGAFYGDGWAELNLLEDNPLIYFLPNPSVNTLLPLGGSINGVFSVAGQVTGGSVPIFVRIVFLPRRNDVILIAQNAISDGSFEAGGTNWFLEDGWTVQTGTGAHTGSKYASKVPFMIWRFSTPYVPGNLVTYLGIEYRSNTTNTNSIPNLPQSVDWSRTGILQSQSFPLNPLDLVYVEGWLESLGADGIVSVSLVCLDQNGKAISPPIAIPGVSSAGNWLMVSEVLQALSDPGVVAGCIQVTVIGQTVGTWSFDDLRVHLPRNLSKFFVGKDNIAVYTLQPNGLPETVYFSDQDFVVDDISNLIFMGLPDGIPLTIRFTENYPAYQCSINEKVWSPAVMLDPARPYPDTEVQFDPIHLTVNPQDQRTLFPITDETGTPSGLTMEVINLPLLEYYFQVTTPAQPQYGATTELEIDMTSVSYMNSLRLAPFSSYPIKLVKVDIESFTSDTKQTIGLPNSLIDRPMILTFPLASVRKIHLTLYQENYTLDEYVVQPPDALERNVLASLQNVLPFKAQIPSRAVPTYVRGATYELGLEDITGINATPILPGVFVAGPHHFTGCPEVFRFDASVIDPTSINEFDVYLCWKAYDGSGNIVSSELVGVEIEEGQCAVWPSSTQLSPSIINNVDISLKFVFRTADVVLQRYLLQVTSAR